MGITAIVFCSITFLGVIAFFIIASRLTLNTCNPLPYGPPVLIVPKPRLQGYGNWCYINIQSHQYATNTVFMPVGCSSDSMQVTPYDEKHKKHPGFVIHAGYISYGLLLVEFSFVWPNTTGRLYFGTYGGTNATESICTDYTLYSSK
jgi:hypothetical protein